MHCRPALESAYCTKQQDHQVAARDLMAQTAKATLEGARQLQAIAAEKMQEANGAKYPKHRHRQEFPRGRALDQSRHRLAR